MVQLLHDGHLLADEVEGVLGLLGSLFREARDGRIRRAEAGCSREAAEMPWPMAEDVGLNSPAEPCFGEGLDRL
jgi:hypothetical protein